MVESQITSSLAAVRPWRVMTPHQSPRSGSCLGEGGLVMAVQVLAPGMPHVLSEGLHAQDIVRITFGRALLLRKAFLQQLFYIVAVRCCRQMVEEP